MTEHPGSYVVDWSERVAGLVERAQEERDWYEATAAALLTRHDRVAVDIGCGGGGMTLAMAGTLRPPGQVVAADGTPEVLAAVRHRVTDAGFVTDAGAGATRVGLVECDLADGVAPVRDVLHRPADLVWASAAVHHVGDQQRAVTELAGLLAPGGRLALVEGGLPARYLPWDLGVGPPGLEERLGAAHERWFARMRSELPGSVRMPYGWTEALRRAGLAGTTTRTDLREHPPPLPEHRRHRLLARLTGLVDRLRPTGLLPAEDLAAWDTLLDPDDPAWLGHRCDLYWLTARSVHIGTRPA